MRASSRFSGRLRARALEDQEVPVATPADVRVEDARDELPAVVSVLPQHVVEVTEPQLVAAHERAQDLRLVLELGHGAPSGSRDSFNQPTTRLRGAGRV